MTSTSTSTSSMPAKPSTPSPGLSSYTVRNRFRVQRAGFVLLGLGAFCRGWPGFPQSRLGGGGCGFAWLFRHLWGS